ncbi:RING-type E3 ubiquitin transferase [Trifolium repens]|nr:RING-type E3 ubiquitin transferase [Trifolium repens]
MEEYDCHAYPDNKSNNSGTENISSCPHGHDKYFNVEFECTNSTTLREGRKCLTSCGTTRHAFSNVSVDKIMQETTIVSWLSQMDVPRDAFNIVVAKVLECARDMVNKTHNNLKVLSIRVNIEVKRTPEDESNDDESGESSESDEEDDESGETSESNGESDEISESSEEDDDDDYDDDSDEDDVLVPASKSSIEELETVVGETEKKCEICYENYTVGIRMPCLHMFHRECILSWLERTNSYPYCRFELPANK